MAPQTRATAAIDSPKAGGDKAGGAAAAPIEATVIQVDDKLYSAEKLASFHPGGELFVRAFAGKDATDAFLSYHRKQFPHNNVKGALLGSRPATNQSTFDKDYLELCSKIEQVLPRDRSFAPPAYFAKVFGILAMAIALEGYIHYNRAYVWYLTGPLGFLFALIGLNIQHDANHGAISPNPAINRALGITQNWIGGSALDWIHQHVVQHHVHTNDLKTDPDILGNSAIRINPRKPLFGFQAFQYLYVFVLLLGFGITYSGNSVVHALKFGNFTKYSNMLRKFQTTDLLAIAVFHLRLTVVPLLFSREPTLASAFLNVIPVYIVGGYYLAFFFLISHNFEGVHLFDKEKENKSSGSFLYAQAASSCNVAGSWLCFINGGLNYQIEHHLFPRIQHSHYPKIAPIVREFCKLKGIPYVHYPTIWENVHSTCMHLLTMGTKEDPIKLG